MHIQAIPRSFLFALPACAWLGVSLVGGCSSSSSPIGPTSGAGGDTSVVSATHAASVSSTTGAGTPTSSTAGVTTAGTGGATATVAASTTGSGGAAATTGTGGGGSLTPTPTGYVQDAALGVVGAWYAYGDNVGTTGTPGMGNCETVGMHPDADCSSISSPVLPAGAAGFPPSATGGQCLTGTAALVIMDATGMPDYSNIFGIGIGLDFNNNGTTKGTWDATMHGVTGFEFDLSGVPASGVRVEFPIPATDNGGGAAWCTMPMTDGHQIIHWADLIPSYTAATQPAFDPTMIESIQVHVPTNTTAAIPVTSLCLSNLSALTN